MCPLQLLLLRFDASWVHGHGEYCRCFDVFHQSFSRPRVPQTALSVNISTTQAFCVISQCLGQIRQAPVFLGRRRRKRDTFDPLVYQWQQQQQQQPVTDENEHNQNSVAAAAAGEQMMIVRSVLVDIVANEDDEEDNL